MAERDMVVAETFLTSMVQKYGSMLCCIFGWGWMVPGSVSGIGAATQTGIQFIGKI